MMRLTIRIYSLLILSSFLFACTSTMQRASEQSALLIRCNQNLTDAQVERHFTPPVAARNYAYPNIATYIALQPFFSQEYNSLNGQLRDLNIDVMPDLSKSYDQDLIAFNAFTSVAWKLVYDDTIVGNYRTAELKKFQEQLDAETYSNSMEYSKQVAEAVLKWADGDMYRETRNFGEFAPANTVGNWKPTSPDYMPAIEPHWSKIRPFVLDSANQFEPERPTEFDTNASSSFYAETMEVYETVNNSNEEKVAIAQFWDCNPNISHTHGHFMYFLQKISPGGHWIHIALQVIDKEEMDLMESAATMALTSLTLHDAFIACWTEKYNSNYIRPETVIKRIIDKSWEPVLQTPAFPEYPSGHSVASASAATILTHHIGDNYPFVDSTEVPFGLPARSFTSFKQASEEAAISRLYGGIHFMPAIENGLSMGVKVGNLVAERVHLKK